MKWTNMHKGHIKGRKCRVFVKHLNQILFCPWDFDLMCAFECEKQYAPIHLHKKILYCDAHKAKIPFTPLVKPTIIPHARRPIPECGHQRHFDQTTNPPAPFHPPLQGYRITLPISHPVWLMGFPRLSILIWEETGEGDIFMQWTVTGGGWGGGGWGGRGMVVDDEGI